jgi:hypothetical protein
LKILEATTARDISRFIDLPFSLYRSDPYFVPQLRKELRDQFSQKNPFFMHADVRYYLAEKAGRICGRVASNGSPVGFLGMVPDFNVVLKKMNGSMNPLSIIKALYYSKKIRDLRLLLLGIKKEYRNKGVDALLFREGFKGIRNGGYKRVEFSWILEDNIPVQRIVEMVDGRLYKKYRIYEKTI